MKKGILGVSVVLAATLAMAQPGKISSAKSLMVAQDFAKAKANVDMDLEANHPKSSIDPKAWKTRGDVYYKISSHPLPQIQELDADASVKAYDAYKKAFELDEKGKMAPKVIGANFDQLVYGLWFKAETARSEEKYDDALSIYEKALDAKTLAMKSAGVTAKESDTNYIKLRFSQGFAMEQAKKKANAKKVYEEIIDMNTKQSLNYGNKVLVYQLYSQMLTSEEDYDGALAVLEKGKTAVPTSAKSLLMNELDVYLKAGKEAEAVGKFEAAAEAAPDNANLMVALGFVYESLGEAAKEEGNDAKRADYYTKATNTYHKAVKADPKNGRANYQLGAVYFNQAVAINEVMGDLPLDATEEYKKLEGERDGMFKKSVEPLKAAMETLPDAEKVDAAKALQTVYVQLKDLDASAKLKVKFGL